MGPVSVGDFCPYLLKTIFNKSGWATKPLVLAPSPGNCLCVSCYCYQKVHIKTSLRNWIKKYGGVTNLCEKSRNKLGLSCAKPMLSNFFKIHSSFPIFSRFSSTFQDCFITRHFPKCYLLYLDYFHQFFIIFSSTFFSQFFNIYSYFKDFTFHID